MYGSFQGAWRPLAARSEASDPAGDVTYSTHSAISRGDADPTLPLM